MEELERKETRKKNKGRNRNPEETRRKPGESRTTP
jgi:hypothetical protein